MSKLIPIQPGQDRVMTYVYSVISRRSGGLSIGINLNPNNACNWRCVYCQVPGLSRGAAPEIDVAQLGDELRVLLDDALQGNFYERHQLPPEQRAIRDIAMAGNGEPTTSPQFDAAIAMIGQVVAEHDLFNQINLVLISNGSQMQKPEVQRGLAHWAELGGVAWFKLDSATPEGISRINNVHLSMDQVWRNLINCAGVCPTWLQTCMVEFDGQPPSDAEQSAYLAFVERLLAERIPIEGVLLYGLDRPSQQFEASRLRALPASWLAAFGQRIEALGISVKVHG
jgi:wyosine [tRNA(Phe)-imidazoG37] synthetase (radical SAM superfamily)